MKSLLGLAFVSLSLLAVGCSGTDASAVAGAPQEDGSEDALTAQLVSGAVAAEIQVNALAGHGDDKTVIVAQAKKLKKLTSAFKKAPPGTEAPRCMAAYSMTVRFLDESAKEVAVLSDLCGFGTLKPKSGAQIDVRVTGDIRAIAEAPLVPADALWGITKVEVNQLRTHEKKTVTAPGDIAKLVGAIDGDQKIDPEKPLVKCLPTITVGFKRKNDEVAQTAFICNLTTPPKSVTTEFSILGKDENADPLARGAVDLDPRPFVALF